MAIQLYREGTTHNVRGIECELMNCDIADLNYYVDQGWSTSPETLEIPIESDDLPAEGGPIPDPAPQDINPIRLRAKEAGIDGWDTKNFKTLEAELEK